MADVEVEEGRLDVVVLVDIVAGWMDGCGGVGWVVREVVGWCVSSLWDGGRMVWCVAGDWWVLYGKESVLVKMVGGGKVRRDDALSCD